MGSQRAAADSRPISSLLLDTAPFFVGYGCLDAWSQMVSASVLTSTPMFDQMVKYLFALLPPLVFILVSGRVAPLVRRRHREVIYLFGFVATFGTFALYLVLDGAIGTEWLPVTNVLLGIGRVSLIIGWWEKLTTLRIGDIWVALGCSIVVGTFISLTANVIPAPFDDLLFGMLPLVSTFLLQTRHRKDPRAAGLGEGATEHARAGEPVGSDRGVAQPAKAELSEPGPASVRQMLPAVPLLLVIVLGLVNIPSEALVVIEHSAGYGDVGLFVIFLNTMQRMLVNLTAVALAYAAMRVNIAVAFYLAVPAITLAAFFLALGYDPYIGILHAVSRIGSETIRYIVVYLLFRIVLERRVPALFCFSLMVFFHDLGTLSGLCAATAFYENRMFMALVFMLVLMAAMLIVIAAQQRGEFVPGFARRNSSGRAFREQGDAPAERPETDSAVPIKIAPDPEELLDAFAARHGLTQRERSVMELWVKGHTTAFVEEQLCVSKHTVKTHVNHIYDKTGVNSKEGLILLYDQFCASVNAKA